MVARIGSDEAASPKANPYNRFFSSDEGESLALKRSVQGELR